MGDYFLGILGIMVSVVLYLIGYRQTIGARKERARSATSEVEKILVRRIVLDTYTPTLQDVSRILEGKARDFRVRIGDLLGETEVLNSIYTRIMETDFITQQQRQDVLARVVPVLTQAEQSDGPGITVSTLASSSERLWQKTVLPLMLAVGTSVIGSVLAFAPHQFKSLMANQKAEFPEVALLTAVLSFAVSVAAFVFLRFRESTTQITRDDSFQKYMELEREVLNVLAKTGLDVTAAHGADAGCDFVVMRGDKKMLIEVKHWDRPLPSRIIETIVRRLTHAVEMQSATEGLIVTRSRVPNADIVLQGTHIKNVPIGELRSYLRHMA